MTQPQLLTIPEAAAALRCSKRHVYDLVARGELRPVDIGNGRSKTRIRPDDLAAYVDRHTRDLAPTG
jgi:excisionase family DNA binding protein